VILVSNTIRSSASADSDDCSWIRSGRFQLTAFPAGTVEADPRPARAATIWKENYILQEDRVSKTVEGAIG
jgi:hypothetical protein